MNGGFGATSRLNDALGLQQRAGYNVGFQGACGAEARRHGARGEERNLFEDCDPLTAPRCARCQE